MLHTSKISLAKELNVNRVTITRMIKRNEVKVVYNNKGVKVGYVKVLDFIKYLLD